MKKKMNYSIFVIILVFLFSNCDTKVYENAIPPGEVPITINLGENSNERVVDYQAQVKIYYSNDRSAEEQSLFDSYRLSTKIINKSVYVRLDYDADESRGIAKRSIITGKDGTFIFNPDSGAIEQRLPPRPEENGSIDMSKRSLFERVDIPALRQKMKVLGYDMLDEASEYYDSLLRISTPTNLLPKSREGNITSSFSVLFDAQEGVMAGSEKIEVEEDGTIITTKITKYYTEKDGIMIPAGEKMVVHTDEPYTVDVDMTNYPVVSDPETVPEISEEEYKKLLEEGTAYDAVGMDIGDPGNPDKTETWLTVYESVSTNTLTERLFLEVK